MKMYKINIYRYEIFGYVLSIYLIIYLIYAKYDEDVI